MLIDIHAHTAEFSACSQVAAIDLVGQAVHRRLDGLVLTDHHHLWSAEHLRQIRRQAQVPDSFLLCSGQEVTTADFGDVLVYGADSTIFRGIHTVQIRHRFPAAALVWAHPWRSNHAPGAVQLCDPCLDAVEIFNSNQSSEENLRGLQAWKRFRFIAVAGSDSHALESVASFPTLFHAPVGSIGALAAAIRQGICTPQDNSRNRKRPL